MELKNELTGSRVGRPVKITKAREKKRRTVVEKNPSIGGV